MAVVLIYGSQRKKLSAGFRWTTHTVTPENNRGKGVYLKLSRRLNHRFDQSRSARLHGGGEKIGKPLLCFCSSRFDAHTIGELDPI